MALGAAVFTPSGLNVRAAPASIATSAGARAGALHSGPRVLAEHRYRIIGKLRLALFWVGRNDVGSARMTWRSDGTTNALTLLIGSDPQRAPRSLNQWGYLREEVRSNDAEVFSLRSLDSDAAEPTAGFSLGEGPVFGVSCASVTDHDVSSTHARVSAHGVTYRMFDQLLDRIAAAPQWEARHTPRPLGAEPGFLTALQHAIRLGEIVATDPKSFQALQPVTYVYNSAVYDLAIRGSEAVGRTTVGTRTFDHLMRTDFSIRNRTTADVSRFALTYSPDRGGANSLPVQIFYQPSFWLRIELRLDEEADVPADPASDEAKLTRIRAICATMAH